jgi:Dolichyl-phosphate-mannose-protein mannosyltransferase
MAIDRARTIIQALKGGLLRVATKHSRTTDLLAVAIIVAVGVATHAPGLSRPGIAGWDEGLHQSAVRGTYATPLRPHIYEAHLYPFDRGNLLLAEEWLHTPPLPLWLAAFVLHFTGITPLAARLVALLAHLGTACFIFWFLKARASRPSALLAALSFLWLRFGWLLVSGQFFGDLIDTTLTFFVTAAMLALVQLAETKTLRAAIGAGCWWASAT